MHVLPCASLFVPSWQVVLDQMTSVRFAPTSRASVRLAFVMLAPVRFVPVRSAPVRFAPVKFAPVKFAPARLEFVILAPTKLDPEKFAPLEPEVAAVGRGAAAGAGCGGAACATWGGRSALARATTRRSRRTTDVSSSSVTFPILDRLMRTRPVSYAESVADRIGPSFSSADGRDDQYGGECRAERQARPG
jgi:hypothetical protein